MPPLASIYRRTTLTVELVTAPANINAAIEEAVVTDVFRAFIACDGIHAKKPPFPTLSSPLYYLECIVSFTNSFAPRR